MLKDQSELNSSRVARRARLPTPGESSSLSRGRLVGAPNVPPLLLASSDRARLELLVSPHSGDRGSSASAARARLWLASLGGRTAAPPVRETPNSRSAEPSRLLNDHNGSVERASSERFARLPLYYCSFGSARVRDFYCADDDDGSRLLFLSTAGCRSGGGRMD